MSYSQSKAVKDCYSKELARIRKISDAVAVKDFLVAFVFPNLSVINL